jgi:hypothetical protein
MGSCAIHAMSLPSHGWVINGQQPSKLVWLLKEPMLPPIHWCARLERRKAMANLELRD